MKNIVNSYVRKFREDRRKSRRAVAMLLALALVVSTGVTWQLHSTGIAMTNETYCGLEEHTHSEDCYEKVLVCGKEESEGHTHDESCYDEEGNLTCGQEESAGHTHTEDCYEEQLTCGLEEHTHTVECLTDITADVETASDWKATLPKLTGDWATDVAAIAESQIGYTESTANFTLDEDGTTRKGYTRYGEWYGNEYGDWDAMFASFCLYYAGVDEDVFPEASGAYAWTAALDKLDLYEGSDYTPAAGDLVFFDTDKDGKADHVGVVTAVTETNLTAVEGDSNDKVEQNTYSLSDSTITGYGVLPELEEAAEAKTEAEAEDETETSTLTYEGEDYTVTAAYGEDAALPENVELIATEYAQDSETYQSRYTEAAELYGWEEDSDHAFRLFNIGFYVDGEEVEPAADVTVTITYSGKDGLETYTVTHFGDEATETVDAASDYADGSQTVQFDSSAFSDYGISVAAEEVTNYTAMTSFYFWLWDSNGNKVVGYSEWGSSNGDNLPATGGYYYTDSDGKTWYLIPISYFENNLTNYGYEFDENDTDDCPFYYAIDANNYTINYATYQASYVYITTNDTTSWYVRVQDSTGLTPPRSNVYYLPKEEGIVLNLGNGNGTYVDNDYSGSTNDALRYTVDVTNATENRDGTVTINLPSDSDLSTTFTVADGITVALSKEQSYDYKLVGWYNIATGEYYNVENGSTTATVDLSNDNVFYADWIAASYDYGSSTDSNLIGTADTSDFVQIHMFDYSELFNLYSTTLTQSGLTSEYWADSKGLYETPPLANALESLTKLTDSFIFLNNGTNTGTGSNTNGSGMLAYPSNLIGQNVWTGSDGNPFGGILDSTDDAVLNKLYDTSAGNTVDDLGVYYVGEGNYLFSYDDSTGYYTYDSSVNAASYNQSDERFYVYSGGQSVSGASNSCFLPYNTYGSSLSAYNGSVNYWFGMEIELDFYLPNDTGTGGNKVNGTDMVFEFSGDDDIWVFVDDELVLDMGGNHNQLDGTIDFTSGAVQLVTNPSSGNGTTTAQGDISLSAGSHTLKVYYMERGGWASNLKVSFNVVPRWKLETATADTTSVTKVWQDADGKEVDYGDTKDFSDILVGLYERVSLSDVTVSGSNYAYDGVTYTLTDGEYYDENDVLTAYTYGSYFYILRDTQTLTYDDGWTYTWELLDSEATYVVRELTDLYNYETSRTYNSLDSYDYWSAVDGDTLNGTVTVSNGTVSWTGILRDGLAVVLTDGAQNGANTGTTTFPTTYTGYVIYNNNGVTTTTTAQFSQAATDADEDGTYTYGVTTDEYVANYVWYVELTGDYDTFSYEKSGTVYAPTFYLKDSSGNYLAITETNGNYSLTTVTNKSDATAFSYNLLGELNTVASTGKRVTITSDGGYAVVDGRQSESDTANVKIYVKQDVATTGRAYTITNKYHPIDINLLKVDASDGEALEGAAFTLSRVDGETTYYYHYDSETGEVTWVADTDDATTITSDSDGKATIHSLDSVYTYTLTETAAPTGYVALSDSIVFTVDADGVDYTVNNGSEYPSLVEDDTDYTWLLTVANSTGYELPSTGGSGTWMYTLAGLTLCGGAALLLLRKRWLA